MMPSTAQAPASTKFLSPYEAHFTALKVPRQRRSGLHGSSFLSVAFGSTLRRRCSITCIPKPCFYRVCPAHSSSEASWRCLVGRCAAPEHGAPFSTSGISTGLSCTSHMTHKSGVSRALLDHAFCRHVTLLSAFCAAVRCGAAITARDSSAAHVPEPALRRPHRLPA